MHYYLYTKTRKQSIKEEEEEDKGEVKGGGATIG